MAYASPLTGVLCSPGSQGSALVALQSATATASGWRSDAYKVMVLFTTSAYTEGGSFGTSAALRTALVGANIVPIIVNPSTTSSAYATLMSTLGFGYANVMQSSWSDAYSQAQKGVYSSINTMWTVVATDTQGFTTGVIPTTAVTRPSSNIAYVNMMYPMP